jgi:hypothetical protein
MCVKVVNAVVILQMLAHGILGCCWHHAHAFEHLNCSHLTVAAVEVAAQAFPKHTCCHGHAPVEAAEETKSAPEMPSDVPEPCSETRCSFVKALSADSTENMLKTMVSQAIEFSPFVQFVCDEPVSLRRDLPVVLRSHSPVERCSLFQAWLI